MRLLYTLAAAVLISDLAVAQRHQDNGGTQTNLPMLRVAGSADITTDIYNFTPNLPPAYFPYTTPYDPAIPQSTYYITPTFFQRIKANGDTVGTGTPIVGAGVTGQGVVALKPDGAVSEGCTPEEIANAADFAGRIVMIARGTCDFWVKFRAAEIAGALGVVIYNPAYRTLTDPQVVSGGMGSTPPAGEPNVGIPGVLVPLGIAQPILDEILACLPVTLQIRELYFPDIFPLAGGVPEDVAIAPLKSAPRRGLGGCTVAAEDAPPPAAALAVLGLNPFAVSTTLRVYTEQTEAVRLEVFNVRGQQVATLFDGTVAGERTLTLSSAGLAAGVYFVRATGETFRSQQQVTVVR